MWRVVDENSDGAIDYGEFMRAFIGKFSSFCTTFLGYEVFMMQVK